MICQNCNKDKKLVCCEDCMRNLIFERINESIQGDIAERVYWKVNNRIDELEEKMELLFKDKQIVCIQRGRNLKKI